MLISLQRLPKECNSFSRSSLIFWQDLDRMSHVTDENECIVLKAPVGLQIWCSLIISHGLDKCDKEKKQYTGYRLIFSLLFGSKLSSFFFLNTNTMMYFSRAYARVHFKESKQSSLDTSAINPRWLLRGLQLDKLLHNLAAITLLTVSWFWRGAFLIMVNL